MSSLMIIRMKQLTNIQTYIFIFGGLMMVLGAGVNLVADLRIIADPVTADVCHKIGACVFLLGAICFASMQIKQKYEGNDFTIKRLRRMMILGDCAFVLAGLFLVEKCFRVVYPLFASNDGNMFYLQYINNNWVVFLLIATFLEVYSTHRIAYLIKKS